MRSQEFQARIVIFVLALACVVDATPAHARTDFDGDWSIFIVNRGGGAWWGQGASGPCRGTWMAERLE